MLRRYLEASLLMADAARRLLREQGIERAVFNHGLYVPQGVLGEVCRGMDIPIANWNPAYRTSCFIFSHGDTYHHTLMAEPTSAWEDMPWTEAMEAEIMAYLKSRWSGTRDWIWFHENRTKIRLVRQRDRPRPEQADHRPAHQRHVGRPAPLPHQRVPQHAGLGAPDHRILQFRPDLQLVIRVHPAEIRGTARSRQPLVDEITKHSPSCRRTSS